MSFFQNANCGLEYQKTIVRDSISSIINSCGGVYSGCEVRVLYTNSITVSDDMIRMRITDVDCISASILAFEPVIRVVCVDDVNCTIDLVVEEWYINLMLFVYTNFKIYIHEFYGIFTRYMRDKYNYNEEGLCINYDMSMVFVKITNGIQFGIQLPVRQILKKYIIKNLSNHDYNGDLYIFKDLYEYLKEYKEEIMEYAI